MDYQSKELGERRFVFCQHCGGDKPWNEKEWIFDKGASFCCYYCKDNFQTFLFRMAQKKRSV